MGATRQPKDHTLVASSPRSPLPAAETLTERAVQRSGDMGHVLGHMDAAHLWDQWSHLRPQHLRTLNEDEVDKEEEAYIFSLISICFLMTHEVLS